MPLMAAEKCLETWSDVPGGTGPMLRTTGLSTDLSKVNPLDSDSFSPFPTVHSPYLQTLVLFKAIQCKRTYCTAFPQQQGFRCLDLQRSGCQVWILEEMLVWEKRERELSKAGRWQTTKPSDLREGREGCSEHSKMCVCVCVCVCVS